MTTQLIERTAREWLQVDPHARARKAGLPLHAGQSTEEIIDALVALAGRLELADSRAW